MAESLRRDLGLVAAAAIVVGTVIGSGIFLVPSEMVRGVGSPGMVFVVWVVGGLLSLFGALTYSELAAAMPEAGGEYVYLREAYGQFWAFIYGWTQTLVAKSASIATLGTGFYLYTSNFWPKLAEIAAVIPLPIGPGGGPLEIRYGQLVAMALIMALGFLNYFGVKVGGNVQVAVTLVKVASILAIIAAGLLSDRSSAANLSTSVVAVGGISGFFAALLASLWAYDGWNNVGMVASEIRNPQRNLPLAFVAGTAFVAVLYILANLAYFYALPASAVASSERVAGDAMRAALGPIGADLVSIAAMISIFAALNGSILTGSRVPYALARDGYFFPKVAHVHPKYATPAPAIVLLSSWAALLVLSGHFRALYTLVLFPSWILYAMATASVIVLRRKRPDLPRPYRTVGYPVVPIAFVAVALVLLYSTLRDSPRESLLGLLIIAAGIPYYRYRSRKVRENPRIA
jgi:basic amino acid/polyamine antiporter, APA family